MSHSGLHVLRPDDAAPEAAAKVRLSGARQLEVRSTRLPQARQGDSHEPLNRALRRQAPGGRERVEAVSGELIGRDVIPDIPIGGGFA